MGRKGRWTGAQTAHWEGLEYHIWGPPPVERSRNLCDSLSSRPVVKNQVTGSFILNPKGKEATSRTFTAMGLEWEAAVEDAKESLKTSGPLPEAIAILVSPTLCGGSPCPPPLSP